MLSGFFAFALSPIGRLLLTAALMFTLGSVAGFRTEKAFSDARWFKAQGAAKDATIGTLNARIKVANAAAIEDQRLAAEAEALRLKAEERAKDAETRIANTPAFDADDVERVRDLWRSRARAPATR
jgi:hypothetical protein